MKPYQTYAINIGQTLDLTKLFDFFEKKEVLSTSTLWGSKDGVDMLIFRDGEIWVTIKSTEDSLKQTTKVVSLLSKMFTIEGLDVDASELLSDAEQFKHSVPAHFLLFSKLKEMRPNLRDKASAVVYRLLVHKGLREMLGDRTDQLLKSTGKSLGISIFESKSLDRIDDAKKELESIFEHYGIGMLSFEKPKHESELFQIRMDESLTASGLPPIGRPVCFLEQGVIESFFSKFYGKELSVKEINCVSAGDFTCRFSVSSYG